MAEAAEWRAKAEALERELAEQQATFDEFQESSRELEKELEAELHKAEAKVKELTDANHRLQRDLLILQVGRGHAHTCLLKGRARTH